MAMNPFPPQAYTRETLIKAYQWLQSQSPQVREVATTPDLLISLFQKAQMQGKESLERPTLQNFKNELRSLAGMMGEFDDGQNPSLSRPPNSMPPMYDQMSSASAPMQQPPVSNPHMPHHGTHYGATSQAPSSRMQAGQQAMVPPHEPHYAASAPPPAPVSYSPSLQQAAAQAASPRRAVADGMSIALDSKSIEWLEEIQRELNLESTAEALRLALSVGYGRLAELFPKRR